MCHGNDTHSLTKLSKINCLCSQLASVGQGIKKLSQKGKIRNRHQNLCLATFYLCCHVQHSFE